MFSCRNRHASISVVVMLGFGLLVPPPSFAEPLVQNENLDYLGAFYLPSTSGLGFTYGGSGIAYNPANNSLFVVGHTNVQHTAEVTIPSIGATASILQPLTDSLAGKRGAIGTGAGGSRIGGNLVYNDRLYTTAFIYYDTSDSQTLSHFSRPLDLNNGQVTGPDRAGSMGASFYSGYMTKVPENWQSRLGGPALTGNCCLSILSRTSYGPAAFAFDPENLGGAIPLVYYTSEHQTLGTYGATGSHPDFNGTTRITGLVFPAGTSSVLFFGTTGIGNYCYGDAEDCGDLATIYKGEHAYPYRAYVWAYDADDFADVRSGAKEPWEITPYSTWALLDWGYTGNDFASGGAAYDPATQRIYVAQPMSDQPARVHVYQLDESISIANRPKPPTGITVN